MRSAPLGIHFLLPSLFIQFSESQIKHGNLVRSILPVLRNGGIAISAGLEMPVIDVTAAAGAGVIHDG